MLRCCLVGDAVVIDNVGHLATAMYVFLLVEAGLPLISALYANPSVTTEYSEYKACVLPA